MLTRTQIRKYSLAMLCSDEIPQGPNCITGPLWENCDGSAVIARDSVTRHLNDANHAPYQVSKGCVDVVFKMDSENGKLRPERFCENTISFEIDIVAEDSNDHRRHNTLDVIQSRIYHRMVHAPKITDAQDPNISYNSPLCLAKGNEVGVRVRDDSEYDGCYTIRTLTFTLEVQECIVRGNCDDVRLCFNFSKLTPLDKTSDDVIVGPNGG